MDQLNQYEHYLLLDVRDEDEYRNGHIPGAISVPYPTLMERIKTLAPDHHQVIMVCCHSGYRSSQAAEKLRYIGYRNVIWLGSILKYPGKLV